MSSSKSAFISGDDIAKYVNSCCEDDDFVEDIGEGCPSILTLYVLFKFFFLLVFYNTISKQYMSKMKTNVVKVSLSF